MTKHHNTDYQTAVVRLLSACAGTDAAEFALMLGVA